MTSNTPPKAIYSLGRGALEMIYCKKEQAEIAELFGAPPPFIEPTELGSSGHDLSEVRLLFSGWGCPATDAKLFELLPNLELILYGAGATDHLMTSELKASRARLTSAISMNAIPVAEFTFACMIFGLKNVVHLAARRFLQNNYDQRGLPRISGAYGTRIGLVSLGYIGRLVAEKLRAVDVEVVAYDPYISADAAARSDAALVGIEKLFETCDVVSLHTPLNNKTKGMFTRALFDRMKKGATLINTARARLIKAGELENFLQNRPDVQAFIDVTYPEPLPQESPLWSLPNVILTPHIAGSSGDECYRMGRAMITECKRHLAGEPLEYEVPLR